MPALVAGMIGATAMLTWGVCSFLAFAVALFTTFSFWRTFAFVVAGFRVVPALFFWVWLAT